MRQYEIRTYSGQVHSSFEAADKVAALALVAADQALLPHEASRLMRLANPADGAENHVWSYPAAEDWTEGGKNTGLLTESEDC